jgi:hypothetical protein
MSGFPVIPHVFASREELETYVEDALNNNGRSPEMGVVDQYGTHWFAIRSAPGGDGYAFEFLLTDPDSGTIHVCNGEETGCGRDQCSLLRVPPSEYGPTFPVIALIPRGVERVPS